MKKNGEGAGKGSEIHSTMMEIWLLVKERKEGKLGDSVFNLHEV